MSRKHAEKRRKTKRGEQKNVVHEAFVRSVKQKGMKLVRSHKYFDDHMEVYSDGKTTAYIGSFSSI